MSGYRLGVDIGGTFTDASLIDEANGEMRTAKVSTTPGDPSIGFMAATERILREAAVSPADVRFVVHGTTVATNAIIEGKVARSAFVTTAGFSDMLEIARQVRPELYNLQFEKPVPLVPRHLCFGVRERLDGQGAVLADLDEVAVAGLATELAGLGIESVAVCLLHSYLNPAHERRIGELLAAALPGVPISLSSDVAPEIKEYLRASTTVINAAIRPVVARYLDGITARLKAAGIGAELLVMQSHGGVYGAAAAARRPAFMVESGPAAGVIAAAQLGRELGNTDVISFDMGGTTAKAGLIQDGKPRITKDYQVGSTARTGIAGLGAAGYPLRTPVVDLVEIGAGGGSIAWIDSGGALRVGPHSAGADPGPVCYGQGGAEPTVTDANLVLGRLDPYYFLGGEIRLDVERARKAIEERCARALGLSAVETALGIVEIANAAMVNALHLVSVQRGYDPRQFVLIAFGGAGPVHANALAAETGIPETLIPTRPGIFTAAGLLVTDLRREYTRAVMRPATGLHGAELEAAFAALESEGRLELESEGVAAGAIEFERDVDTRYLGQGFELTIGYGDGVDELVARFHREHDRAYGYSAPGEPVELVNLRLAAIGRIPRPEPRRLAPGGPAAPRSRRQVYFAEAAGFVDCPVFDRYSLSPNSVIPGPAVIQEYDATTVVHPGFEAVVDAFGNLRLSRPKA